VSTTASAMMVFTALLGFSGIMLNSRPFLAVYTFLLWVCLGLMVSPGYIAYKQRTFNLEGKINLQWSRLLGTEGRLRIQDAVCPLFVTSDDAYNSYDVVDTPLLILKHQHLLFVTLDPTCLGVNLITSESSDKFWRHGISVVSLWYLLNWES
jgi:hypothetical protein